jgi:hypothetical protein
VDLDVVLRDGDAFFEAGVSIGRDLDRDVTEIAELRGGGMDGCGNAHSEKELPHQWLAI